MNQPSTSPAPFSRRPPMYFYCLLLFTVLVRPCVAQQLVKYDPDFVIQESTKPTFDLPPLPPAAAFFFQNPTQPPLLDSPPGWFNFARGLNNPDEPKPTPSGSFFNPDSPDQHNAKFGYRKKTQRIGGDPLKARLAIQESRSDGFHYDQSYDVTKESTISRLGIVLSSDSCRISPSPILSPDAHYFVIECPPDVSVLTAEFLSGAPFKEAMSPNGNFLQKRLDYRLPADGSVVTEHIQACLDGRKAETCYEVQIDAKRSSGSLPMASRVFSGSIAQGADRTFQSKSGEYRVSVFENEPVEVTIEGGANVFTDLNPGLGAERGFIDQTNRLVFRPRGSFDHRLVYLTDREHLISNNLTIEAERAEIDTSNAMLYDLRTSTGRLDPAFRPNGYAYFLRVSEFARTTTLRFTAMDDRRTECSYADDKNKFRTVKGAGSTVSLSLGRSPDNSIFVLDCIHPTKPDSHVRYIIQVVRQRGGSTLLKSLDVVGGTLQQPFKASTKGVYNVNMRSSSDQSDNLPWISFLAVPRNRRAMVDVEGFPVDPKTTHSPYFRIELGETRQFRLNVRTRENSVSETYIINVHRPVRHAASSLLKRLADVIGYFGTAVSSTRAYHFIHNAKMLQWFSVTHRINGLPETYDLWSRYFNKWNLQYTPTTRFYPTDSKTPLYAPPSSQTDMFSATDSFVAPPQAYGRLIMAKWATPNSKSLMQTLPVALQWDSTLESWVPAVMSPPSPSVASSFVDNLTPRAFNDTYLSENNLRRNVGETENKNGTLGLVEEEGDNDDFLTCAPGDEASCPLIIDEWLRSQKEEEEVVTVVRRLAALGPAERQALVDQLEVAYKNSQLVLDFTAAFVSVNIFLVVVGIVYAVLWVCWLHAPDDLLTIRKDFPRVLYPARFWLFVLDYALICYTQTCLGLWFSPLQDAEVSILGGLIRTTPAKLSLACICLLVLFPVAFVALGCGLLGLNQGTLVFTRIFQKHSDPRISGVKSFWRPLPALPIFGRIFDIEITRILEGQFTNGERNSQEQSNHLPPFEQENRTIAPWDQFDSRKIFGTYNVEAEAQQPLLKSSGGTLTMPRDVKYYRSLDAIKLGAPEYSGMNSNHDVVSRYPEAFLAYNKQPVRNVYGESVTVHCEVLLKHWAQIAASREDPPLIVPRESLDLVFADALSNLISKAQMKNFGYWAIDRLSALVLIGLMSSLQAQGVKTLMIFCLTSACLCGLYTVGSVIPTSLSAWYRQMEADYHLAEKYSKKYLAEENAKFAVWPFKDPLAREHFKRVREVKEQQKVSHWAYGLYAMVFGLIDDIRYSDFWKTRRAMALRAFWTGPAGTELFKFLICLTLALGSRSVQILGNWNSSLMCFILAAFSVFLLNWDATVLFFKELRLSSYEWYIWTRRILIALVDLTRDSPNAIFDRLRFYVHQTSRVFNANTATGSARVVSFVYPGFQRESLRDFNCREVSILCNEVGVHMSGAIVESNRNLRRKFDENDPITVERYGMQKTLFVAGTIGVFRPELDRAMPVVLPITQFCNASDQVVGRIAGTIQIVNHSAMRYIPRVRHDWRDDSFLSLWTNPKLVPGPGSIRKGLPGHGYVIKVDKVDQVVRIRGPGILAGKTYNIKLTFNQPPIDDLYTYEEGSQESSRHLTGLAEAEVVCRDPGRLVVPVPIGCAPDLQEEIIIHTPGGREEVHDPARHKVVWDPESRVMVIRTQHALLAGNLPYRVVWSIKPRGGLIQATTNEPPSTRGEIRFLPSAGEEINDLDSAAWCVIRDTEKKITIDIDPRQTNAYEFLLSELGDLVPGSSGFLTHKLGLLLGELDCIRGLVSSGADTNSTSIINSSVERIPCTLVQCVDPIGRKWRVEPDFEEAVYRLSARKEELLAMNEQLRRQYESISDLWYRIISPYEYVSFWSSRGIDILDAAGGAFVDPMRSPHDPKIRPHIHIVHAAETALQTLLSAKLAQRLAALSRLQEEYKVWAAAYRNIQLYEAQANLDSIQQDPESNLTDVAEAVELVRQLKRPYEQTLPAFVYPMIVQEKLISKAAKWEAQFLEWERQLNSWLKNEEGAAQTPGEHGDLSGHEFTSLQIMRLLRFVTHKPELLSRGRTQTALHYVTSSRAVRGAHTIWQPDPLGASLALVRAWGTDPTTERAQNNLKRWEICFLKLTGTGIKIMLPLGAGGLTAGAPPDATTWVDPWNNVVGWYIPFGCFEAIFCMEDETPLGEDECAYNFGATMTGKLVFRRNTEAPVVHDNYIKRCSDGQFDNKFVWSKDGLRDRLMLGFTSSADDPSNLLPRELWYEQQQAGNKLYTYPLTFRLWQTDLARWESVVKACAMDRPPRDNADFDGAVPGQKDADERDRQIDPSELAPVVVPPPTFHDGDDLAGYTDSGESDSDMFKPAGDKESDSDATEIINADKIVSPTIEDEESSRAPSPEPTPRPPPEPAKQPPAHPNEFAGDYQDWRFNATDGQPPCVLHDALNDVAYEGDIYEGQRNGRGAMKFQDRQGRKWRYDGEFAYDEPCGQGHMRLDDPDEMARLGKSSNAADKNVIVGFQGNFVLPKKYRRNDSLPLATSPMSDLTSIEDFFRRTRFPDVRAADEPMMMPAKPTSRSQAPKVDDKLAPFEPRDKTLTLDPCRSLSACGHENILDVTLRNLTHYYFHNRGLLEDIDEIGQDQEDEMALQLLKDGEDTLESEEPGYLPHECRPWTRLLDPGLGYADAGRRLGSGGEVQFADGVRYRTLDDRGLGPNNKPDGKGWYHCPQCPLVYYGDFRRGRPEGYGCLEFGPETDKVTYWGSFKDGKFDGEGLLLAKNDKLRIEGHFSNDQLGGGRAVIQVNPDLKSSAGLNFCHLDAEFKDGLPNGRGNVTFFALNAKDNKLGPGLRYQGEFKDGLREGKGIILDSQGRLILKGTWEKDQAHGRVDAYHLPNGLVYVGPMKNGDRAGLGKLFESVAGGLIYDGTWDKDLPHGRGTLYAPDGTYEGEFFCGKREGKGVFTFTDSPSASQRRTYEGSWKDDKPHGVGVYLAENDESYTIEFNDGKVVPKSLKPYRQGGPCGSVPTFPDPHIADVPAIGSKHKEYQEKGVQLQQQMFTNISKSAMGLWTRHEEHPFVWRRIEGAMPEPPLKRDVLFELAAIKEEDDDSKYVYRLVVRNATDLPKVTGRKPRAAVRIQLLHHDVSTKADEQGGQNPTWNQTLILPFVRTQVIVFAVCDCGTGMSIETVRQTDRVIGYGLWNLGDWLKTGQTFVDPEIPLEVEDKKLGTQQAGRLKFTIEKVLMQEGMEVHRDQYDYAAIRNYEKMPGRMLDSLFSPPVPMSEADQ